MLSPSSINLGCSWNSLTRNLTSPDNRVLSSARDAAVHSDNGTQVKVANRTYRVVVTDNRFCVTRESHTGCFTNLLHRLGWPKGEISRKIEAMLNSSPVNIAMGRGDVHSNRPDLPPVDYALPELPGVDYNRLPVLGNVIGKGGNAVVYEDAEDATKVLKMFTISQSHEEVTNEVRCFNKYYGAGSAEKIYGDNDDVLGIRMNKINGESLFNISSLPVQAEHAIYDMFDRLEQKGILFIDTTETNVLYDRARNEFNPIDISSYNVSDRSWSESQIMQSYHGGKQDLISVVLSKI
ncbi:type III secretion system effector kinase NleH [Escherichia albertii]|uniref:type III secretion system effector kinase NleH n=1 Tax=Escherichia albertii TaxID=208962 RepID=UPI000F5F4954|nr:type III secretion system effector kinase NleH [Escherichia albertii]QSZ83621.1 T3SS effector protein NleH [Escherichia albertii]QSZ84031.1 T3SS effector protein NleH [Escherichia albertii]QSZ92359.1 T3SS effector protein NleH [Escherichia albertii]QSZ96779.1 T3SS effector protein NleH [Escherichia albertii]QSZ97184.1 T3SS effector protein NleH [Escherichia albertii]